ncbi:hypothetical protein B2M26_08580 [Ferroacidibacillus organovorans]|uniref:Transposase n=1 Tax=Ferroacidibacillus organovorans TaxID=1765683 RepID=A0A1V4ET40_9BACL|nr:hypothetical protein B2M26_08580 [Ferroacidibacillus organovorans]
MEDRTDLRNGSYHRLLTTRVGTLTLQVPRFCNGQFLPNCFHDIRVPNRC